MLGKNKSQKTDHVHVLPAGINDTGAMMLVGRLLPAGLIAVTLNV